jgi:hypothetical protein
MKKKAFKKIGEINNQSKAEEKKGIKGLNGV